MASWLWVSLTRLFVYAHHKHRLDSVNAGNFGDCLTGRVRFMTAITLAFAHAYQTICLAMHLPGVPHFLYPTSQTQVQSSTLIVPLQENWAMIIMGGLFILMVVFALLMAKSLLDGV